METKSEFRAHFRALRDGALAEDRAAWSDQICTRLAAFCLSRRIRRIGAFWPLGSEIDLRPLIQGHPDWVFVFPRISSTNPPRLIWGPEPLEKGLFGLMEPTHAQHFLPPVQLLLVPGLAFDALGFRLGYGKGFYDALLGRFAGGRGHPGRRLHPAANAASAHLTPGSPGARADDGGGARVVRQLNLRMLLPSG